MSAVGAGKLAAEEYHHYRVQIHPDKKSVLVTESGSARIQRYYFAGPKRGRSEIFIDNLPGYPDNVRLSSNGKSFFVALFSARGGDLLSFSDRFAQRPLARKLIGEASRAQVQRSIICVIGWFLDR